MTENIQLPEQNFPTTTGAYQTIRPGGTYDAFVFKLNPDGTLAWRKQVAHFLSLSDDERPYSFSKTTDGSIVIVGEDRNYTPPIVPFNKYNPFILKIDADGNTLDRLEILTADNFDGFTKVTATNDGGAYVIP